MKRDIIICETGTRDGLQNLADFFPTPAKKQLISLIAKAGFVEIDATSFVPPKVIPQFSDSAEIITHALSVFKGQVSALVPNFKGAERALESGVHALAYVISASKTHNMANVRRTIEEQLEGFKATRALINETGKKVHLQGAISTAFGCSLEGRIDEKSVLDLAQSYLELGADEIGFADTVGYATPKLIKARMKEALKLTGKTPVRLHLHDTLGLGVANAIAGIELGITRYDSAISGLGGCPFAPGARGNIVSEDFIFACEEMGLNTGIDLDILMQTREILTQYVPQNLLNGHLYDTKGVPKLLRKRA